MLAVLGPEVVFFGVAAGSFDLVYVGFDLIEDCVGILNVCSMFLNSVFKANLASLFNIRRIHIPDSYFFRTYVGQFLIIFKFLGRGLWALRHIFGLFPVLEVFLK